MLDISVYLNPHASKSSYDFQVEEIKKHFLYQKIRFNTPGSLGELIDSIIRDRKAGVDCIFSIGGDGTAHVIAQNLIGSKTKLMVLPGGTANDFAHEMGTHTDLKELASIFHARVTREIDIIKVNDRYLMTNGGLGIAHQVAQEVNAYRKKNFLFKNFLKMTGKHSYSLMFIKQILTARFELLDFYLDSPDMPMLEKKIKSPLIFINNQPRLAGKFPVAPLTRNNDGKFNVTIFLHDNKIDFIKSSSAFLMGKFPKNDPNIIQFETDSLHLISLSERDLSFFGDGENFTPSKELQISLIPKGLVVYTHSNLLQ